MPNRLRIANLAALKHPLCATMPALSVTRPLIGEFLREELHGQHRSTGVKFPFALATPS